MRESELKAVSCMFFFNIINLEHLLKVFYVKKLTLIFRNILQAISQRV